MHNCSVYFHGVCPNNSVRLSAVVVNSGPEAVYFLHATNKAGVPKLPVERVDSGVSWNVRWGWHGCCSCRMRVRHRDFSSGVQNSWYSSTSLVSSGSNLNNMLIIMCTSWFSGTAFKTGCGNIQLTLCLVVDRRAPGLPRYHSSERRNTQFTRTYIGLLYRRRACVGEQYLQPLSSSPHPRQGPPTPRCRGSSLATRCPLVRMRDSKHCAFTASLACW